MSKSTLKIIANEEGSSKKKTIKFRTTDTETVNIGYSIDGNPAIQLGSVTYGTGQPPDPTNKAPKVDAGDDITTTENITVTLNGSAIDDDGRIVRQKWTAPDGITLSDPTALNPTFVTPSLGDQDVKLLMFHLEAEDDKAEISNDDTIVVVTKDGHIPPPPPPVGDFPIPVKMSYSSDMVLSHDGVFPSAKRSPIDPILLFSNASGAKFHTVKDGWLIINTGAQFGRCYWEMYELPDFPTSQMGLVTAFAGVFKMSTLANDSNYSIKLGNHGTTGYDFDGKKFFGGFGVSFHSGEIQSKAEWKHGTPEGTESSHPYKNGNKLEVGKEYPYLVTWVADQAANTCILNVWIDFGNGWELTVDGKTWSKDSEWVTKAKSLPLTPTKAMDYDDVQKGPAFIRCDHIWTRANEGNVSVQKIQIGTLQ